MKSVARDSLPSFAFNYINIINSVFLTVYFNNGFALSLVILCWGRLRLNLLTLVSLLY
jgi:hypothetical protein